MTGHQPPDAPPRYFEMRYSQAAIDTAVRDATTPLAADLADVRTHLTDALGGPDAVPANATVVDLAVAVASQNGGFRNGLGSAGNLCRKWAAQLNQALYADPVDVWTVNAVREALARHATGDDTPTDPAATTRVPVVALADLICDVADQPGLTDATRAALIARLLDLRPGLGGTR